MKKKLLQVFFQTLIHHSKMPILVWGGGGHQSVTSWILPQYPCLLPYAMRNPYERVHMKSSLWPMPSLSSDAQIIGQPKTWTNRQC